MEKTRLSLKVYRSNTGIEAQLIIDVKKSIGQKFKFSKNSKPVSEAKKFGEEFGKKIVKAGYDLIAYDRGKSLYHGVVKEFAEGLRSAGVKF
jgi:large subunit ribosomal protein L18